MRADFGILEARAPRRAADKFALRANFRYTNTLYAIARGKKPFPARPSWPGENLWVGSFGFANFFDSI